jgi:outer membrane receptor protein involved in Fe transport
MRRFALLLCLSLSLACAGQHKPSPAHIYSGVIMGPTGQPVAGADLQLNIGSHSLQAVTADDGGFRFSTAVEGPAVLRIRAAGFAPFQLTILSSEPMRLNLKLATDVQRVVVTASRTPLALDESANAVQVVSRQALQRSATLTLGDRLRQVTGLNFFRRSSTLVANPTSQGVSLRGLGSTAASRTLVLANGIPISDPFGGWIYWDQVPLLAIDGVEVVSGGVSSLYGSSAVGGVINIIERQPNTTTYALDTGYAQENTPHLFALATTVHGPWSGMAAGDLLRTDGYIEVAPDVRGPVDTRANVHYQNGEVFLRRIFAERAIAYLRGNVLNEARGNGTPLQSNATRLWRYSSGLDWTTESAGVFSVQLFGSQEHYRQSFSSVPADQSSESLTRLQYVTTQQLGASAQWTKTLLSNLTLLAGADADDVRATDYELPILHGSPNGLGDTSARQRDVGEYAEALFEYHRWTLTGSVRGDDFLNLNAVQNTQTGTGPITETQIPDRSESILSPKLGVVRHLDHHFTLTASAYRAFRSPTLNELYRQGQVGQEITLANPHLLSERATGWEAGTEFTLPSHNARIRASYFWTEVNRPVTALTLSVTPSKIVNQRENLGQVRSRGVALNYEAEPFSWLAVTGGYQYANATVTQFVQEPQLVGKWIPQVPHNTATMQVRATKRKVGLIGLLGTVGGRQYDDAANVFLLHDYFQLNGYVSHELGSRVELYGAMNNMFNRSIEIGRTPILTLATPRMASFGIRIHSPNSSSR